MLWSSHRGVIYQEVFEYLPPKIRQETVLHIADLSLQALIFKVFRPLVQGDVPSLTRLTRSIADRLCFNSYPRGECVLTEGMLSDGLFFVVTGQLVATSRRSGSEKLIARYTRGDYFGERGILTHSVSEISVRTQVECDLLSLSADSLAAVLRADDFFAVVLSTIEDLFCELRQGRSRYSSRLFPMALNVWDQLLRRTLQQQRKQWAIRSSAVPPLKSEALWSSVITGVLDTNDAPFACVQLFRSFVEMVGPQGELFERTAAVQRRESIVVVRAKAQQRQRIRTLVRHIGAVAASSTSRVAPLLLRRSSSSRRLESSARRLEPSVGRVFTESSRRRREALDEN
ncbi:hypothetical protein BBJ28_00017085 [Nothophytophthora sp. Chile5]|nr:hypothetical protein BBJ28_00017085 [Nothophytophthora sp. Chile5]